MARNYWSLTMTAVQALTAATLTAIFRLDAPANQIVALQGFDLSFDGAVVTAVPVVITVLRVTTTGTGMTARLLSKTKDRAATLQSVGAVGPVTAANLPTAAAAGAGDSLKTFHIHPQAGVLYPFQLNDQEIEVPGGGRIAIEVTAPAAVNVLGTMYGEE
jgi:hypothetical protein